MNRREVIKAAIASAVAAVVKPSIGMGMESGVSEILAAAGFDRVLPDQAIKEIGEVMNNNRPLPNHLLDGLVFYMGPSADGEWGVWQRNEAGELVRARYCSPATGEQHL